MWLLLLKNPYIQGAGVLLGCLVGLWFWGQHKYDAGFTACKEIYTKEEVKLKKESDDAIKAEQVQSDTDKQFLASYYNGVLQSTTRAKQTSNPERVSGPTSQCEVAPADLQFESQCAEDAAKLVRVRDWALSVGLKGE